MLEAGRRIGVLGGTFDPPHAGHVAAARAVRDQLALDELLLVVAHDPWQKSGGRAVTPAEDRLAMTEAMVSEVPGARVSRAELDRGGPSYSVDTVEDLLAEEAARRVPAPEVFLIVGADLLAELDTWHRAEDLRRLVTVAVVSRPPEARDGSAGPPDHRPAPPGWRVVRVDGPAVPVSSSQIRALLARGEPVGDLVPQGVMRCIRRRGLYAVS